MADTLEIFGVEYTGVTGIIATNDQSTDLTYIRPQGTKSISANGTGIDVAEYASVNVSVPSAQPTLQTKSVSYTPTESAQTQTVTADSGYDGLSQVNVSVGAIDSEYIGSAIDRRSSSDVHFFDDDGYYVAGPPGFYGGNISVEITSGTAGTPTATKGSVSNHSVSVTPSVTNTTGYITGGTKTGTAVSVSASELVSGTYTVDSSGTKDVTNYASASIPAGTAGTPSASKGAVSNHSVSVTPSVTNTTGWITGSTKTGTAVTVSASELVSGSETKTENGTYDVTNLAEVVVNVSGGGGLEYETGTWTPTSDASGTYIYFTNTHTTVPMYINIIDTSTTTGSTNSNLAWTFINWHASSGTGYKSASSTTVYGRYQYAYKTSSGKSEGSIDGTALNGNSGGLYYLVSESVFYPYCGSNNRYWRSGHACKWIAVWAPTA